MARIALVTKSLTPEVITLAKSLVAQQNDLMILTGRDVTVPDELTFQVLRPFRKWNATEAIRLFPRLLSQMPDVVHFVFSKKDDEPTFAHWLLSRLVQPIPRKIVAASFFHSPMDMNSFRLQAFLRGCHMVTWGARVHLLQANREFHRLRVPVSDVLPPFFELPDHDDSRPSPEVERLVSSLKKYLIVPGNPEEFFAKSQRSELHFEEPMQFLFLNSRKEQRSHDLSVFFLGSVRPVDLHHAIKNAVGVLLAFSDLSMMELQGFYQWSQRTKTPLLVRPLQNDMSPGLVLHNRSGWVLEEGEKSLRDLLLHNPSLRTRRTPDEEPSFDMIDSTMNEINRLYSKAISLRS